MNEEDEKKIMKIVNNLKKEEPKPRIPMFWLYIFMLAVLAIFIYVMGQNILLYREYIEVCTSCNRTALCEGVSIIGGLNG